MDGAIPDVVVLRLPLYVRALTQLHDSGIEVVSSHALGEKLQITPAQIRKDLSYFGRFGKQGRGYNVGYLLRELRTIMGLDQEWKAALVGVGRLGRAIISYPGFAREGFQVVAIFDASPDVVGTELDGIGVRDMSDLGPVIRDLGVHIGIVAVPEEHAQSVVELTGREWDQGNPELRADFAAGAGGCVGPKHRPGVVPTDFDFPP